VAAAAVVPQSEPTTWAVTLQVPPSSESSEIWSCSADSFVPSSSCTTILIGWPEAMPAFWSFAVSFEHSVVAAQVAPSFFTWTTFATGFASSEGGQAVAGAASERPARQQPANSVSIRVFMVV
jgi:hypothetical protein